jgi:hypothetical protein
MRRECTVSRIEVTHRVATLPSPVKAPLGTDAIRLPARLLLMTLGCCTIHSSTVTRYKQCGQVFKSSKGAVRH